VTACTDCGAVLAVAPPLPGTLAPVWAHAVAPADGHEPGIPPVNVTYREDRGSWDAECPEVPGFPVRAARNLDEARSVVQVLLLQISPARPAKEHVPA
jgi:hypothetical protein